MLELEKRENIEMLLIRATERENRRTIQSINAELGYDVRPKVKKELKRRQNVVRGGDRDRDRNKTHAILNDLLSK